MRQNMSYENNVYMKLTTFDIPGITFIDNVDQ